MRQFWRAATAILLQALFPLLALAAAPTITSLTPNAGAVGSAVVIAGSNFGTNQANVVVKFNGSTAAITALSSTSITATVPSAATTGNVVVTVSGVASNGVLFTVTPPPSISSLTPNIGAIGSAIVIAGSNFGSTQGNGKVTFNGTNATISSWSATQVIALVPNGATTGNVVLKAAGGVASNGVPFTVTPAPKITSLVPNSGPIGSSVTINGSNFGPTQGNGKVTFNGTIATVSSWSATQIVVTVPSGATTGNVVVTAAGGVASNGVAFTVIPPPSITSLTPTSGLVGASVTVTGKNFGATQGTSTVTFNGAVATASSWSNTSIVVTVPAAATTGNVVVTVSGNASNGVLFKVLPHINAVSPTSQPVGKAVTISGNGFGTTQSTSTVTFGGVTAAASSWSTTQISTTVPSGVVIGSDPIVVTVGGSASNSAAFTVVAALAVTVSASPQPNANGWNNSNVTLTYQCSGGVLPVQCPASKIISTEGANQAITATATDANGNTATATATLNIDKTAPTVTATVTPTPNAQNVVTAPATITFTCADSISGIASCPSPIQVNTAGLNEAFSGTTTDKAGNSATANVKISVQTAPLAVTATAAPAANAAGWNNSNVTISYACSGGIAPLQCPASQTVSIEGANQIIHATVTDAAGQTASASTTLNIDKTPPTITAVVTPVPNAQGVVTAPATISFTCSDALSGIATCGSPIQVTTAGLNQAFSGTATDKAGNSASANVTISVQTAPLAITATAAPAANAAGWNNSNVTISYACSGGIAPLQCPPSQTVSIEGANQIITATVTDAAGQTASASTTLNIDKTPPTITAAITPVPNAQGVVTAPATITFTCSDALSGIATCGSPIQVTTAGLNQAFSGTATDKAGNSASVSVTISVQSNALSITATATPVANAAGWNNSAVTISYTCSGGVAPLQCPASQTVSTEGANQIITATVTDAAGQTASASTTLNIDTTPPLITAAAAPAPNAQGWNNTDVTITFTCSDALSGIAICPPQQIITAEGANQNISGTATDVAGNSTPTSIKVSIDKTPPTISATITPAPDANGIVKAASATVSFTCFDALSGILSCAAPVVVNTNGAQTISGTATDNAGNSSTSTATFTLQTFPPLVVTASVSPSPNAAGWNNSPVTVSFQCTGGAPPVSCPSPQTVTTDGANQVITGTATDAIGNSASASATVNLDQTPPLVTITSPTNNTISTSANVTVTGLASDGLSGLAAITCNTLPATISGGSFTCSLQITQGSLGISVQATDVAGNTSSASLTVNLQGPKLTITSPASQALFSSSAVTVTGTVDDPSATITVNGVPASNNGGTFTAQNVILREGNNVVTASGTNPGGAVGTASVSVILDTTPPTVSIDSPSDKAVLTTPQIYVTGLVNDVVTGTVNGTQVSVMINGVKAEVGNRSFMAEGVLLVPGQNVITAVATDRAGNVSQSSVTVTLQDAANQQRILMISGNDQTAAVGATLDQPLVVEVVNAIGQPVPNVPVTFTVNKSDGQLTAFPQQGRVLTILTDDNGQASANFQLGTRVGKGNNQVLVTSPGFVGEVMFCASSTVGPPSQIHDIVSGSQNSGGARSGAIGQPLPEPLVAGVFDASGNPVSGVQLIFKVERGGGKLEGSTSVTKTTDSDGKASAILTLAQEEGVDNNVVSASFTGFTGSPAIFTASGLTPGNPSNTTVSGIVLDNADHPIPNATASIQGSNLTALTDSNGRFSISNAPVGSIVLFIDGSTSTDSENYPFLEFPMVTVAGQDNNLGRPIYLPVLDTDNSKVVGGDEDVVLTMKGAPGVAYTVFAHSATFPDGTKVGRLTLSQVHGDKVPMAPPNGTSPGLVGTLQPSRVKFNPPIRIQVPNSSGLPPGQVVEVYSFDHDLEQFVSGGTGRVSPDGSVIVSDPGFGLRVSGWHAAPPPPPPPTCADGCEPDNECNTASCQNGVCVQTPTNDGGDCSDGTSNEQCGQGGTCESGECVFDSTTADGTPCTPDDKCVENAKCQDGQCEGDPFDPHEHVEVSGGISLPPNIIGFINNFLSAWIASVEIEEVEGNVSDKKKDCCSQETGIIRSGIDEKAGSLSVKIHVAGHFFGPPNVHKTVPISAGLEVNLDIQIGVDVGASISLEGKGGHRSNSCEQGKDCFFGEVNGGFVASASGGITILGCLETFTNRHCLQVTPFSIGVEYPVKLGLSHDKEECGEGNHGWIQGGALKVQFKATLDIGLPINFQVAVSFDVPGTTASANFF